MTDVNITIEDLSLIGAQKPAKVIHVAGQLDESNIDEKSKMIYDVLTQNPQGIHMVFDFENLSYMNSKSIGYLTDWYGKVTGLGAKMIIIKAKPNIVDILQVIGLTQLIPMFGSIEEAKFALTQPETNTQAQVNPVLSQPQSQIPQPTIQPIPAPVTPQPAAPTPVPAPAAISMKNPTAASAPQQPPEPQMQVPPIPPAA